MIYAFHISTKSALFPSFNKGSKEIKEAGEGRREERREEEKKRARKASGLKRKKCNTLNQPDNLYGKFHCIYKIVLRINEWV